jgi:hypothetical protein
MFSKNSFCGHVIDCLIPQRARFATILVLIIFLGSIANAQVRSVAPIERGGYQRITSYDSLQAFLKDVASTSYTHVEPLTKTRAGRTVSVAKVSSSKTFGQDTSKIRVLLFAQQHGDEPAGMEALSLLLAKFASGESRGVLDNMDLLIVPQMNPDGGELRQRRTSDGLDLNRNHVLLTSPEVRALHDLFFEWMPQVTMDIHEYTSFGRSWSDSGFIRIADVQLGMLTNLNTASAIRDLQHERIFPFIAEKMKGRDFYFQEYIVGSPGARIRHSTTEINDGRQSFGILGTVAFIQEGRRWKTNEDHLERRVLSQLASIEALLEYCSNDAQNIRQIVYAERCRLLALAGQPIALRMDHYRGDGEMYIPVRMVKADRDSTWRVKPYYGEVRLLKSTLLPQKYLLERKDSAIVELLLHHHINVDAVRHETTMNTSSYFIDSVGRSGAEENALPLVSVSCRQVNTTLRGGDFTISTGQLQSVLVAIILEPESMWGLTRYEPFAYVLKGKRYPVLRIP